MNPLFEDDDFRGQREPAELLFEDFDWEALYERLGEGTPDDSNEPELVETVIRLLVLFLRNSRSVSKDLNRVGLRVVALAWVLSPGYFPGNPSLRELAHRYGTNPTSLAMLTKRMSRLIRWRNHAQRRRHASRKPKQTTLQVEGCDVGQQ